MQASIIGSAVAEKGPCAMEHSIHASQLTCDLLGITQRKDGAEGT